MTKTKPALERAARALCHLAGHPENIKFEGKPMWQSFLPEARAVLTAIREPSEAMILAGVMHSGQDEDDIRLPWQSMIDAVLIDGA